MKKVLITLDEKTATLLEGEKNKSKLVREAVQYIKMDISPDTIDGLRRSYDQLTRAIKEIDAKIDFIDKKIK